MNISSMQDELPKHLDLVMLQQIYALFQRPEKEYINQGCSLLEMLLLDGGDLDWVFQHWTNRSFRLELNHLDNALGNLVHAHYLAVWFLGFAVTLEPYHLQMATITKLDLSYEKQGTVPETILNLTHLQELRLKGNDLIEIPDWIECLEQLEVLDIAHNQIQELPSVLLNLPLLRELIITGNPLHKIPPNIQGLEVDATQLWKISPEQLQQLESLSIVHQAKLTLPNHLRYCRNLRSLSITGSRFLEIPDWFDELIALRQCTLSGLSLLTFNIALPNLEYLDISHNRISELPDDFNIWPKLRVFKADHNQINEVSETLGELSQLTEVNLNRNALCVLPDSLGTSKSLRKLWVSHNYLWDLPETCDNLEHLTVFEKFGNDL